ncbi:Probable transmembrane protein [Caballeronia glathei]|uniref:Membrane protein n=1 Tax=Caballeronia glathei TaxID=60547 RepID=A0A069PWR8_9BURK|nr:DUF2970 domain-containing protein [Caballeronia glathei]KDR44862.1 membrane protein [Caballeronia glathei]CEJ96354.1 Probable transmembrane protein [Caballeronia glathei]
MVEVEKPGKPAQKMSFLRLLKAVFWSFFGVRRRADLESDAAQLNPLHVVAAAVLGAVLFIIVLLVVVRAVVG